jgi:hypothetical protein
MTANALDMKLGFGSTFGLFGPVMGPSMATPFAAAMNRALLGVTPLNNRPTPKSRPSRTPP